MKPPSRLVKVLGPASIRSVNIIDKGIYPHVIFITIKEMVGRWEDFAVRRVWRIVQKYQEKQVCPSRNRLIWSAHTQRYLHVPAVKQALDDAMCVLTQFT